jgi:hypothetical protein
LWLLAILRMLEGMVVMLMMIVSVAHGEGRGESRRAPSEKRDTREWRSAVKI